VGITPLLASISTTKDKVGLLDCGCGDGSLLFSLKEAGYLEGRRVSAVDLPSTRLNNAKIVLKDVGRFYAESVEDLKQIEDGNINIFMSTQVIEHVDDKKFSLPPLELQDWEAVYIFQLYSKRNSLGTSIVTMQVNGC
jgi:2-polyprenyl-3-methyl-5-hydroxy-6-metoxy-1,4-benzoquinol methylase